MSVVNTPEALVKCLTYLGEGPHWDDKKKLLYFVDINNSKVLWYNPENGKCDEAEIRHGQSKFLTLVVPVSSSPDDFVVALDRDLCLVSNLSSPEKRTVSVLHATDKDESNNRLNDGKCDPRGRLFAGTMANESPENPGVVEPEKGSLYRVDGRTGCTKVEGKVTISNGLDWSSDHKTFFFIDSLVDTIVGYDYDVNTGDITNKRVVFDLKANKGQGILDGMAIDQRGHLWVAMFKGHKVIEVIPDVGGGVGRIAGQIDFPECENMTSVAFGGADCADLFVTSSRTGDPSALPPLAGTLFRIKGLRSHLDGQPAKGYPGRDFVMS